MGSLFKGNPWLVATPDCFLYDPNEEAEYGFGKVKCPFAKKAMTIQDPCSDSSFLQPASDQNPIPTVNNYYYQLQGLMATCNVIWADLIVYTPQ